MTTKDDKFVDLDAAFAEIDDAAQPMRVRLFSQDWELPGSIPAAVSLRLFSWHEKGWIDENGDTTSDIGAGEFVALLRDLVPRAVLAEWFALGLGTDKIDRLTEMLISKYEQHLTEMVKSAEGKAPAPGRGRGSSTSSNGGRSSKPTSTASTKSRTSAKR